MFGGVNPAQMKGMTFLNRERLDGPTTLLSDGSALPDGSLAVERLSFAGGLASFANLVFGGLL